MYPLPEAIYPRMLEDVSCVLHVSKATAMRFRNTPSTMGGEGWTPRMDVPEEWLAEKEDQRLAEYEIVMAKDLVEELVQTSLMSRPDASTFRIRRTDVRAPRLPSVFNFARLRAAEVHARMPLLTEAESSTLVWDVCKQMESSGRRPSHNQTLRLCPPELGGLKRTRRWRSSTREAVGKRILVLHNLLPRSAMSAVLASLHSPQSV